MKLHFLLALLFWPLVSAGQPDFDLAPMTSIAPQRLILVTFRDRTMERLPAPGLYRLRGSYSRSSWSDRIVAGLARDYHLQPVVQWPMTEIGEQCVVYGVPEDLEPETVIESLRRDRRVFTVQSMRVFNTRMATHQDPYFRLQENLHWIGITSAHQLARGQHVRIAVIDTTMDDRHPDLENAIAQQRWFFASKPEVHGTAMAGIIAARADNHTGIVGVAPGARLIALQGCWSETAESLTARCNTFSLALALNTALKLEPRIINLSLSGPEDPLLRRLIEKAIARGIVVVAAESPAGGEGFPASVPGVIAAGEFRRHGKETGPQQCFPAPHREILTTFPGGGYNFVSGSSAAAAQISGIIALLLELDPDLGPTEIRRVLRQSIRRHRGGTFVNAYAAARMVAQKSP